MIDFSPEDYYTPELVSDEVFELACSTYNTDDPTDDQLEDTYEHLEERYTSCEL